MSKKPRRRPVIEALEKRTGKTLRELAEHYAAKGYSRREAAQELGVSIPTFRFALDRECPDVAWPAINQSRRRKAVQAQIGEQISKTRHRNGTIVAIKVDGEHMALNKAARHLGINPVTLHWRYQQGLRGDALTAPVNDYHRPDEYKTGLSLRDYAIVLKFAQKHGNRKASRKFDLPLGAIAAAQQGEWWKLA